MNGPLQLLLRPYLLLLLLLLVVCLFPFGNCSLSTPIERIGEDLDEKLVSFVSSTTGIDLLDESYNDAKSRINFDSVNGETLVEEIAKSFGDLFGRKIEALQLALKRAEELTAKYQWNSKITVLDVPGMLDCIKEGGDVSYMHARDLNEFNESFAFSQQYGKRVSLANSSAHIPVDIYKGDVEILNSLAWTADMDQVWKENKDGDPGLLWQYFGSQSGVLRFYPASKWRRRMDADLYDVRRRPWYTQGASSPKEMLILVDRSGSSHGQALSLMKHSVKSILETVGENDFVNVASFSETASWVGCFSTLVQGNQRNKQRLSEFVDNVTASGVASYAAGLEFGFQQLENFTISQNETGGDGATCNQVIMFLTDGGTEMPVDVIRKYNPDKRVRIFSFAVGPVASLIPAVKWIACSNRGYFYQIPAMGAIRSKVQGHLAYLSRPLALLPNGFIQWSSSYVDALSDYLSYLARPQALAPEGHFTTSVHLDELTTGLVATATVPVFNRSQDYGNQTLLGILGVDISMKELVDSLPRHKFGPNGYAFAINSNGYVVFHPQLKIRESSLGSPPSVDLLEVEEETPEKVSIRRNMIDRKTGSMTVKTYVIGLDEAHADVKTRTYYYTPIPNTNFSLAIVLPDYNKVYISGLSRVDITSATHNLQPNSSTILLDYGKFCTTLASPSTTLDAFINFLHSNYTLCNEAQVRHLLFDAQMTAQLHEHWVRSQNSGISKKTSKPLTSSSLPDGVVAIVAETNSGLTLVYPPNASSLFESTLNPWDRTHFKRAFDSDVWIYSLLTKRETNTTERLIMATKAVSINANAYKVAAVSLVLTTQRLHELISDEVDISSPKSSLSSVYYLLDDGAMIIDSSDPDSLPKVGDFFGLVQRGVMSELVNMSFYISHRQNDYQRMCSTKGTRNAGLRLLPSFLYELISLRWWTSAYAWVYFHLYSWLFHGTYSSSALEEEIIAEQSHRTCILALQQYHFGAADSTTNSTKGIISFGNCTGRYEAVLLRSSNLLLVVIEQSEDCSHTDNSKPYLPEEIGDPLIDNEDNKCHVAVRYRRRPACYDVNPHEATSYCRGSLATRPMDVLSLSIISCLLCSKLLQQLL